MDLIKTILNLLGIFNTKEKIKDIEEWQDELNTHSIFTQRDKDNLNPLYNKDLKKLRNKKSPFGIETKKWGIW
jgi:hypothetical protein